MLTDIYFLSIFIALVALLFYEMIRLVGQSRARKIEIRELGMFPFYCAACVLLWWYRGGIEDRLIPSWMIVMFGLLLALCAGILAYSLARKRRALVAPALVFVIFFGGLVLFNFIADKTAKQKLNLCCSYLRTIADACEVYYRDSSSSGQGGESGYPDSKHGGLNMLTPTYFKALPHCPSAGQDTYAEAYESAVYPPTFTIYCKGSHHPRMGILPNYPQYSSNKGLILGKKPNPPR